MSKDEFSGIVRSGAAHSVSVSERTGNAKTPKNIVRSDEEETLARAKAYEEKSESDDYLEKISGNQGSAHIEKVSTGIAGVADKQKATGQGTDAANVQTVANDKKSNAQCASGADG